MVASALATNPAFLISKTLLAYRARRLFFSYSLKKGFQFSFVLNVYLLVVSQSTRRTIR